MGNEKHKDDKNFSVAVSWRCADMKLLLLSLFSLCSLITVFQLFPSDSSILSCFSRAASVQKQAVHLSSSSSSSSSSSAAVHPLREEQVLNDSTVKRSFNPVGSASYLFIQMGAYRGGANNFAVVGLASKPLHVFAKPRFECEWIPHSAGHDGAANSTFTSGYKILPDWGYGRVYTVVVVNCTFPAPVGLDGSGGRLVIHATTGGGGDREVRAAERFVAVEEDPGSLNASAFEVPPRYDYLYCGSSLYGNLSPARVREWMAYHARLFGEKAHFVFHDAGGVHPAVMDVLRPWVERGTVTLQDIREQERFDGYYHNQFLVVNDCLHRYKFAAKWIFFFDLDEFIYLPQKTNLASLLSSLAGFSQFTIEQMPMSSKLCRSSEQGNTPRMWGIEKLVYRDVKRGVRRDRKYAIQPRQAFATGVHMSQNVGGRSTHRTGGSIKYFHYHGTIADRREPCREFVNTTQVTYDGTPYVHDETLRQVAGAVRRFEMKTIGTRLSRTRQ